MKPKESHSILDNATPTGQVQSISKNSPSPTSSEGPASSMKYISLTLLLFQNVVLILVMRYVRTRPGELFLSSTAVVFSEFVKFVTCMGLILYEEGGLRAWARHLHENIWQQPLDCLKIMVPSVIYMLQNNLLYVAISNLEPATYQVTYQLKILTTAIFSVVMLRKELSRMQWVALVLLFLGVATVQLQPHDNKPSSKIAQEQNPMLGLVAVCISCVMSGFAGVYFEKLLKGTKQSLWLRNVQLGSIGMVFGAVTVWVSDGDKVREKGFFHGYDWVVVFVCLLQSFGGLMVAVVIKYADNILKGFATSGAIIISCLASWYLFDFEVSLQFVAGATLVILAVFIYGKYVPKVKSAQKAIIANKV